MNSNKSDKFEEEQEQTTLKHSILIQFVIYVSLLGHLSNLLQNKFGLIESDAGSEFNGDLSTFSQHYDYVGSGFPPDSSIISLKLLFLNSQ